MTRMMNRKRAIGTVLAAGTAAALGAGIAQAIPAGAAAAAAPKYVVLTCKGNPDTKPVGWSVFCGRSYGANHGANSGAVLWNMRWTTWTSHLASGYGFFFENDKSLVRVVATLWGSASVKGQPGERTYTRITLMFPGKRPTVYREVNGKRTVTHPQTQTIGS
jgi:hypothetical protein